MKKLPDWQILFDDFLQEKKSKPFKWGEWDCCKFSNALIKAMTGKDLIPKTLKWKDEESAIKAITSYGGDLESSIEKVCNEKKVGEINKAFMTCGDLVVYSQGESYLVGICDGFGILTPSDEGINVVQNDLAYRVWRFD
jgi:hypothetical protein|tara:strand:+ start:227 stop:643 length:417 start_codon:yes stop_codon:yes gene_type:complete